MPRRADLTVERESESSLASTTGRMVTAQGLSVHTKGHLARARAFPVPNVSNQGEILVVAGPRVSLLILASSRPVKVTSTRYCASWCCRATPRLPDRSLWSAIKLLARFGESRR